MADLEVTPLHLADVTYPEQHPLAGQTGPVLAFAVRHPRGVVLVDTGIGEGDDWIDEHYQPVRRGIRDALTRAGLDPASVGLIVHTHLHFDHCGQDREFPGVPIVSQRAELAAAREDGYTIAAWVNFPGAAHEPVEGDAEVAEGVSVLATPGHTTGHQSVLVRSGDTLTLIVGQAAQDAREFGTGPADQSVLRLRELNADRVHFSHDRAVLRRRR
jgi:glyoxylase-like metal-dependent hydrolase (beta-lactamase superfamily II)